MLLIIVQYSKEVSSMRNYATEEEKRIWKERYLQGETARENSSDCIIVYMIIPR